MALTLRRFFEPKVTNLYPEVPAEIPPKFRGRLQLLYDEYGTLKCETCFQCAQACPIECIDMGGTDTKGRYAVHWGAPETYGERREESALRRSGRTVPDPAYEHFHGIDLAAVDAILDEVDHDPKRDAPDPRPRSRPRTATSPSPRSSGSARRRARGTRCCTARRRTTTTSRSAPGSARRAPTTPTSGALDGRAGRAARRPAPGRGHADDRPAQDPLGLAEGAHPDQPTPQTRPTSTGPSAAAPSRRSGWRSGR